MKRVWVMAVGLAVVVGAMWNVQAVSAADEAVVSQDDVLCGLPGADVNGEMGGAEEGHVIAFVENEDKVMFKCKGDVTNLSGMGQHFEGFDCAVFSSSGEILLTNESHASVSASGEGMLTCTYRKVAQ